MMWGRRVVTAALAGAFALGLVAGCGDDEPTRDDEGAIAEEGDLGVTSVKVGDCFNDPEGAVEGVEVEALAAVPCDQPHDNEAYHRYDLPDGDFPGQEQVEQEALEGCVGAEFQSFIGVSYDESAFEVTTISPTEETWNDLDDREVICAVYIAGEELTGSARDSAR